MAELQPTLLLPSHEQSKEHEPGCQTTLNFPFSTYFFIIYIASIAHTNIIVVICPFFLQLLPWGGDPGLPAPALKGSWKGRGAIVVSRL